MQHTIKLGLEDYFNDQHYIRVILDTNAKRMQSSLLIMAFSRDFTNKRFLSIKTQVTILTPDTIIHMSHLTV